MGILFQNSCIKRVDFTSSLLFAGLVLCPSRLDILLQTAFSTAEVSDGLLKVLFFAELRHEDVQGILRPLLYLLPVAIVVVLEVSSYFLEEIHGFV